MKSKTVFLVAFGFAVGLGVGLSGPLGRAGDGLVKVLMAPQPAFGHADRITASADNYHGEFQSADFRWPTQLPAKSSVVCAPQDDATHKPFTGIQHL